MKVEVISKEHIKPSSPTPNNLKTFNFSVLDQFVTFLYAPVVLFYPNNSQAQADSLEIFQRTEKLKQSLSETLTRFYPLAGTVKDHFSIDCNDTGAYFAVAQVDCHLCQFLNNPDLQLINCFLPFQVDLLCPYVPEVASIQLNFFQCGGIAIGLCILHKILDGTSLGTFLNIWAAISSGSEEVLYPDLSSAMSLFSSKKEPWIQELSHSMWGSLSKKAKFITRRFVFEAAALETLKAEASRHGVQQPTRVVMVAALIWKCAMDATAKVSGSQRQSLITPVVNMRKRSQSTLSENSIGNLFWYGRAECKGTRKEEEDGLYSLANLILDGISTIDAKFLKKLQSHEWSNVLAESVGLIRKFGSKESVDCYNFTSWCKMGYNEADFGWGKPIWVTGIHGSGCTLFVNTINLLEISSGEGIEAWVTLDEAEMSVLQVNQELLAFARVDTSPLLYANRTATKKLQVLKDKEPVEL